MVNNFTNIKKRIRQIAKDKNISYEKLYKIIQMTDGSFKGSAIDRPINSDAIVKLYTHFPDIDLHWLITGQVKYHTNEVLNNASEPQVSYGKDVKELLFEQIENVIKLKAENIKLIQEIESLKKNDQS